MRTIHAGWVVAALAFVAGTVLPLGAQQMDMQHPMHMTEAPLDLPETRMGSGTSWIPDASPMHAAHFMLGAWTLMVHGNGFLQYDRQGGIRGDNQIGLLDWAMVAASRDLAGGRFQLRGMFSTDFWGVGGAGYPLLLQSGESYQGAALHDRQHPHDLFMELAALYERPVARNLGVSVYVAPVGEPAVGPAAFPHRPSAANDPLAPIGHHWQDGTHIAFGVATLGLFTRTTKIEASIFNGREPDEDRTDVDYAGRTLDSYSLRVSINPGARWSLSAWYAYLKSPEQLHPDEALHRLGAAALMTRPLGTSVTWSSALIYGANAPLGTGRRENSVLLETNLDLDGRNSLFGRAEYVEKNAEELVIPEVAATTEYNVGALSLGYIRDILPVGGATLGLGAMGTVNVVPASGQPAYGSHTPLGLVVFVRLRPRATRDAGMSGMHMDRMGALNAQNGVRVGGRP